MRVNKENFLQTLESVFPGCSPRELLEQSSCFAFKNGKVMTFNDNIACIAPSLLDPGFEGAVKADKLLNSLRLFPDDEMEITSSDTEMFFKGKGRRIKMAKDERVMLPIDSVEDVGEWASLDEEFLDAAGMVESCAGKDESEFALTCVHVHPHWVEAYDGFQLMRYKTETNVQESFLVRKEAIKHASTMGMTKISESDAWVHFSNSSGLQLSSRRYVEDYPDLGKILACEGESIVLPKGMTEAAERANIFSEENPDDNLMEVNLSAGAIHVVGRGVSGSYEERKQLVYSGPRMRFLIAPTLLGEITKKYSSAQVTPDRLIVEGGRWKYVTVLHRPETDE